MDSQFIDDSVQHPQRNNAGSKVRDELTAEERQRGEEDNDTILVRH